MTLPEICIRRPVLATVLNLLIVLLGLIAYDRLSVREYPNIDQPTVTVETFYRGAPAELIESQVTRPLEDALSGIEGVDYITSISRQEKSQITLNFKLNRDSDAAAADVRDRVARARDQLPDEVDEPVIAKVEADALPIIYLAFASKEHTELAVTEVAERVVADQLKTLPGVSDVAIYGARRYSMRVWLDPARLAAYRLTTEDVENAIRRQNLEIAAGRIESVEREFTISGETDLKKPEEFGAIILRDDNGYLVRLSDVARVELGPEDERVRARYNGQPSVALGVIKQSTANPLEISKALRAALPKLQERVPKGMTLELAYDSTVFISSSIEAVWRTMAEAVGLVVLVIFFFLRRGRATLIPLVTIPVSLIGTFSLMALFGFTVNTLTLLSLVLAVGLVVDDAIVVLENCARHIEEGMKPLDAAMKSGRELVVAVIAMSITLAAVFAPMAFAEGRTGRLFTEFALTLAGAVLISGVIALTLTPMMCAYLLRGQSERAEPRWSQRLEAWFRSVTQGYSALLARVLRRRALVMAFTGGALLLMVGLYALLPKELSPLEDRSYFVGIGIAPEGASVDYTDSYTRQMEAIYETSVPHKQMQFAITGFPVANQIISFVRLAPWDERPMPTQAVVGMLFPQFMGLPGILAFPVSPPSLGQRPGEQPVQFVLQTTGSYDELNKIVQGVTGAIGAQGPQSGMVNLDSDLKLNKPEFRFVIDREKAALLGIDVAAVGNALQTLFGSRQVTRFTKDAKQYDVLLQVDQSLRRTPQDLTSIYLRAQSGEMVQLANLVTIDEKAAPRELNHFNKLRSATITASLLPGVAMGDALAELETAAKKVASGQVAIDYLGQSREFRESGTALMLVFLLALAFIYLVLAAQYESYRDPLTIMLAVPLALTGALLVLWLTGGTLNVYSQIGLITLIGLITKHGILMVDFANRARDEGAATLDAIIEAASVRFRPILMTTAATILGAIPLALSHGAGAESRQQIGWVIVGGMSLGTLLTLFVIPVAYTFLTRKVRQAHALASAAGE